MITVCWVDHHGELYGGGQQSLLETVLRLPPDRVRPIVICGSEGSLVDALRAHGVSVYVVDMPSVKQPAGDNHRRYLKIQTIFKKESIGIIHANSSRATWYALQVCDGLPVISHARVVREFSPVDWMFDQWTVLKCSRVIANSQSVARRFMRLPGRPPVEVIPNAIDLDPFKIDPPEDLRFQWGLPPDIPLIGLVGMLDPRKGHSILLRAAAKVREQTPCALLFAGREAIGFADYKKSLEEEAKCLNLSEHVYFLGQIKDIPSLMKLLDICVLPVVKPEGFGRVIIEAFAAQCPVIASRLGGISEIISHGEDGLLVKSGDVNELSGRLLELIKDPALAQRYGKAGRRKVEQYFEMTGMIEKISRLYEAITEAS